MHESLERASTVYVAFYLSLFSRERVSRGPRERVSLAFIEAQPHARRTPHTQAHVAALSGPGARVESGEHIYGESAEPEGCDSDTTGHPKLDPTP